MLVSMRWSTSVALVSLFALVGSGCSGGSKSGASPRSSMLTVSAAPAPTGTSIAVDGGSLDLQTALFHVGRVEIEESTAATGGSGSEGEQGEQGEEGEHSEQGEHGEHGQQGNHEGGAGENGNESGSDEIVLDGPFTFDIASGEAVLDSVPVVPGAFRRVQLSFLRSTSEPFADHSIVCTGSFHPATGSPIPFTLRSRFVERFEVPIANGGITVGANAVLPIAIVFDLAAMLGSLDFRSAAVENGVITIDESHNTDLLEDFEENLGESGCCVERSEHSH